MDDLADKVLLGGRRDIGRAISRVERGGDAALELLHRLHPHTGRAWRVGITGPPGAGKSTLTAGLAGLLRRQGHRVAIVAVDPTSPYSSGALLGDRIRMPGIENDEGIFIRSMASRGSSGGLSAHSADALDVLDAAGFNYLFLESVGVGQVELRIEKVVDSTVVVLVPESGDQVQAIKAGLMEIADLYILNKSDRQGSNSVLQALYTALSFKGRHNRERDVPVLATVATAASGLDAVLEELEKHRQFLQHADRLQQKRQRQLEERIRDKVYDLIRSTLWNEARTQILEQAIASVSRGQVSPEYCARAILDNYVNNSDQQDPRS